MMLSTLTSDGTNTCR